MFDSLLRPSQIRTNNDAGLLRLIACVCMCIDHAGKMLFPELTWMRLVGRLAFPLFAYGIAVGAAMTKSPTRYLSRVMALALISQPLYAVALDHTVVAMYAVPFTQNPLLAAWNFYLESWHTAVAVSGACDSAVSAGEKGCSRHRPLCAVRAFYRHAGLRRRGNPPDFAVLCLSRTPFYRLACCYAVYARVGARRLRLSLLRGTIRHAHLCPACRHARLSAHPQADADAALVELWLLSGASAHFADS